MNDLGIGSGMAYEYVVAEKKSAALICKKICLILLYVLWATGFLVVGITTKLLVPLMALVPLTLWILLFLTWRFTVIEYELSFFSGVVTVSRIYGGRTRKKLAEITIRELEGVCPCEEPYTERINAFAHDKEFFAASSPNAPELWAAMGKNEDGTRYILWFEPTEKALKVFRFYNSSAVAAKKNVH
ncbi:MAG: hypothetical protein E7629_07170 [Ruminococcaceae bacterium]|nr:hypothetical protein [Oscillospiraceae bacterium]